MDQPPPPPPPVYQPVPKKTKTVPIVLGIVTLLAVGFAVWMYLEYEKRTGDDESVATADSDEDGKFELTGALEAPECGGGFAIENADVQVRNEKDELIGSTTTGFDPVSAGRCRVEFTVELPVAEFYQIKIGTHEGPTFTFEELEAQDFEIELKL